MSVVKNAHLAICQERNARGASQASTGSPLCLYSMVLDLPRKEVPPVRPRIEALPALYTPLKRLLCTQRLRMASMGSIPWRSTSFAALVLVGRRLLGKEV